MSGLLAAALACACNALTGLDASFKLDGEDPETPTRREGGTTSTPGDASVTDPGTDGGPPIDPDPGTDGAAPDAGPTKTGCPATLPAGMVFCEDFEGRAAPAPFGWDEGEGTVALVNGIAGSQRALQATAGPLENSTLVWSDWDKAAAGTQNLAVGVGQTLTTGFSFQVLQAGTYAVLGSLQVAVGDREFGLAVYPDGADTPCPAGKAPCIGVNSPDAIKGNLTAAVKVQFNHTYRGSVVVKRTGDATWSGTVSIDGAQVGSRGAAFTAAPSEVTLNVGAYFSGNQNGQTSVVVDDVQVVRTP